MAYLLREEAWHLGFRDAYDLVRHHMFPIHEGERGRDGLPRDYADQVMLAFGREGFAESPAAIFDIEGAKQFVYSAWREAARGRIERAGIIAILRSLDWVPYTSKERRDIFSGPYNEFRRWAGHIRRNRNADPADVAQIGPIGEAFKLAMNTAVTDLSKARDPLAKNVAMAVVAAREKDAGRYLKLARQLYVQVRDYREKKTPYGAATIAFILANRQKGLDAFDIQCEILADALSAYEPGKSDAALRRIVDAIVYKRWNRLWEIHSRERDKAKRLNDLFCGTLERLLKKGKFSKQLFDYVRATRRGRGWTDPGAGADLFERMIRKKTFLERDYRLDWRAKSATVSYMSLLRHEFANLAKKYSPEQYFDDMFIEEARRTRYL
ncbi:MAG: hypothetical protein ACYTFI_14080, partial [Planctomycetota bacterium]